MEIQWKYNGNKLEIHWKYNGNAAEILKKLKSSNQTACPASSSEKWEKNIMFSFDWSEQYFGLSLPFLIWVSVFKLLALSLTCLQLHMYMVYQKFVTPDIHLTISSFSGFFNQSSCSAYKFCDFFILFCPDHFIPTFHCILKYYRTLDKYHTHHKHWLGLVTKSEQPL